MFNNFHKILLIICLLVGTAAIAKADIAVGTGGICPGCLLGLTAGSNIVVGTGTTPSVAVTAAPTFSNVTDSALTSGNCVQASTAGLLSTISNPCGTVTTVTATGNLSSSGGTAPAITMTSAPTFSGSTSVGELVFASGGSLTGSQVGAYQDGLGNMIHNVGTGNQYSFDVNGTTVATISATQLASTGYLKIGNSANSTTAGDGNFSRSTTTGQGCFGGSSHAGCLDYGINNTSAFTVNGDVTGNSDFYVGATANANLHANSGYFGSPVSGSSTSGGTTTHFPPVYTNGGADPGTSTHIVFAQGTCTLSGGTCIAIITFSGNAAFTSATSYSCGSGVYGSGGAGSPYTTPENSSGSQVNILIASSTSTGTAQLGAVCVGY